MSLRDTSTKSLLSLAVLLCLAVNLTLAAPPADRIYPEGYSDTPMLPHAEWRVHDIDRPQPRVITPGTFSMGATPPSDAIVLFDGTDLSQWKTVTKERVKQESGPAKTVVTVSEPKWKLEDGHVEATEGDLVSARKFGDCQLHIEWATPADAPRNSVGRGNSGVIFMEVYELQVLDSFNNRAYADGHAGALYGQYPPLVNASRGPGEWQAFDIIFEAPEFDGETVVKPAYVTVFHNGALVQHRAELIGAVAHKGVAKYTPHDAQESLLLQGHGNPTRFRNIWIRPLKGYDE